MTSTPRIVSLLPAATEVVHALGAGDQLVGRSHECDYPTAVERLPACTSSKLDLEGTSYRIDERVKALLQEGLSIYRVDGDALATLRPDVVITQDHCEVCAASLADLEAAMCTVLDPMPSLVVLRPTRLEDVIGDFARIGVALGLEERALELVDRTRARMERIRARADRAGVRPTVALIEWLDPPMAAGNWMPTLVEMAGGRAVLGETGAHSPWLDWDALLSTDPDVIVVVPCGYGIARTLSELPSLESRPGWQALRAVRAGRVFVADGHHYFNRPGPRIVESLEILAQILHPPLFDPDLQGSGWVRRPSAGVEGSVRGRPSS